MTRHWSEEAREAARQRIYRNKPWTKSTGAKTEQGKATASRNSTNFINQVKQGLWVYLPKHKVFARKDTSRGTKLLQMYQENNWLYGDPACLINGIERYGDRIFTRD
ncbi:MAG: hypothetical protein Tsb0014_09010 [Pleurocapsa sp.]